MVILSFAVLLQAIIIAFLCKRLYDLQDLVSAHDRLLDLLYEAYMKSCDHDYDFPTSYDEYMGNA